jgi:hypothetical protein
VVKSVCTVALLVLAGCGRMGYDAYSDDMHVVATSAEIRIESPGRFVLVFDQAHAWQASSWVDLTTGAETELAGGARDVLQAPFAATYGGAPYEIDAFDFADRAIYEIDEDRILFRAVYGWVAPDESELEAITSYEIFRDGTWNVTAAFENKNDTAKQFGVVYAQTSLAPGQDWVESQLGDAVQLDAQSGAQFSFDPGDGLPGTRTSDGMGNFQYDAGLVDLGPYATFDATWTNRLLP